jgi:alkaline phosphatase D
MKPAAFLAVLMLAGCAHPEPAPAPPASLPASSPAAAVETPAVTVAAEPAEFLPVRGDGPPPLPLDRPLTRIALGSCSEETAPIPILAAVAQFRPDLFLYVGDNVYGDAESGDMKLPELRKAYADLSMNAHFSAFNMAFPILATWDDHDYGLNDAGADFPAREVSERVFETFWRDAALGGGRPGVYGARIYGPPGYRVQVILLDTRFFRSPLRRSETPNAAGYKPYLADPDPAKTMLGEAQWAWLAGELRKPAEIRLVVSSIQVLADGHPFERWGALPREQDRLERTIAQTGAKGVVLLSGDRHLGAIYRRAASTGYPLHELTASSLNLATPRVSPEASSGQVGAVVTHENFGAVEIDWPRETLTLSVRVADGSPERRLTIPFRRLGLASRAG